MPTGFGYWGVDSVANADGPSPGSGNLAQYTMQYWPGQLKYWGRYFGNSPGRYGSVTTMRAESDALVGAGFHYLVPINAPGEGVISLHDYNRGGAEATAATDDIQAAINAGRVDLPNTANHGVYIYLDVEQGAVLTQEFWNGWFDSLRNRFIVSPQYGSWQPIYPAAYANPNDTANMNILLTAGRTAWGLWTPIPSSRDCTYCQAPGPNMSNAQGQVGLTMHLWQYGLAGACVGCSTGRPNVDLDETNPDFVQPNYMLWIV